MLCLQLAEAGKRGQDALFVGLGVVDAGHERFSDLVQTLVAQPPAHELSQRLIASVAGAPG